MCMYVCVYAHTRACAHADVYMCSCASGGVCVCVSCFSLHHVGRMDETQGLSLPLPVAKTLSPEPPYHLPILSCCCVQSGTWFC